MLLVIATVPNADVARAIAQEVIVQRLAACVNILPAIQSIFHWQGRIEEATEVGLLIKTSDAHYAALEQVIINMHPYQVPEIIALPISRGLPAYLDWITGEITKDVDEK